MAQLDTQALAAFIAVAEHSSFSVAAEHLHLTQPAVSKRVALLEQQLGQPVFDRIRRRVHLTEAGATLLPLAKKILLDLSDAAQRINDLQHRVGGDLSIAFSHHIGLHRLPPYLRHFSMKHPNAHLNIRFIDSEAAYRMVTAGDIELAVITLSPDPQPHIHTTPLWTDPLAFVCSPDHALHLRDNVSLQQLSEHYAILPSAGTYTGKLIAQLFEEQSLTIDKLLSTNYLETIKMMVSIGLGWSVLPKTMTESLEEMHVPDHYIERQLGVIQYADRRLSNAARAFRDMLQLPPEKLTPLVATTATDLSQ